MQITELTNNDLNFEVRVIIPSSKITDEVKKEIVTLSKKVKIDGFRAGKVPLSVVSKKYEQSVILDVVQHQINHAVQHVIKDNNLKTVTDPQLENLCNEKDKDLEFTLKFELLPTIELPDFKKIMITRPVLANTEEDINKQIELLVSISKNYNIPSVGMVQKGQQVIIDAIGYVNNEAFEGGKLTDHKLVIGSGTFIEGFEDQLIGAAAGDEVEVNVTFPEEYNAVELAGKAAKFIVQVKSINSADEILVDDEFAQKFNCKTLEELRNNISKRMQAEVSESVNTVMKMSLFDQLEALLTFNVPESLKIQEINVLKSQVAENSDSTEVFKDKSEQEIDECCKKISVRRVKMGLFLNKYIQVKGLRIEQDDISKAIIVEARKFPGQEMQVFDFYQKNPKIVERLKGRILEDKAVEFIFNNEVTLEEKSYSKEEIEELFAQEEARIV